MAATENRGPELLAVNILFLVLAWTTALTRCWVRIRMIKAFAIDDWLLVATLVLFTVYCAFSVVGVHWGCGRHMEEISVQDRVNAMRAWYYGEIFYIICSTFLRLAVGAFLLRVAVHKTHRRIVHFCNAVNVLFNAYFLLFTIVQCTPISGFWTRFSKKENVKCHPNIAVASTFAASGLSALIDWTFGVLPVFILWDLNVNKRKKITLGLIMGLGAVASTAPVVRIPYTASLAASHDFLWETIDVAIWSSVEPGLGITAVSLVALRPLFVSLFGGFSTNNGTHTKPCGYGARGVAGTPGYRNISLSQSGKPKPNIREGYWDASDGSDLQLHGLPPSKRKPLGHTVTVQGGVLPSPASGKPSKNSGGSSFSSKSGRRSDENEYKGMGITRTTDVRTYDDDDDESHFSLNLSPVSFTPLDKKGGHVPKL